VTHGEPHEPEGITDLKAAVAASERQAGASHPATLEARVRLALGYREREQDALTELEQVVVLCDGTLGPVHPDTVDVREHNAYCHRLVGRGKDEVSLVERIAADHARLLGPAHPRTLHAQVQLASRYFEGTDCRVMRSSPDRRRSSWSRT
jgi:hypothetical protein